MVYYHTSENIKKIRNIIIDYRSAIEVTPYEYMQIYIEKCPETVPDGKISWIAETFLGIQKHELFLKSIASHLSERLSEEEQDYFMITFYAIIFQIGAQDMQCLYKCLFNLSKTLLDTFTKFLANNEVLAFISEVAQADYDTSYITEKIIAPLFTWQPYISEMGHSYCEYVKKMTSRKIKPLTVPIQPKVLSRKPKEPPAGTTASTRDLPATPPNSVTVKSNKKMLTKSEIDQKLQLSYEKNKQKAENLLNDVKNKDYHFAQVKSDKFYKKLSNIREEYENELVKPRDPKQRQMFVIKQNPLPIKETTATLKRMNKRVQLTEQDEIKWLEDLLKYCTINNKEELEEYERQERERERLYDIERKHLVGQISHEEAVIAKKKLLEENKKRCEEIMKEKEMWHEEIENWKKMELEKNRKQVEKMSFLELNLVKAKNDVTSKKKEIVEKLKKESEMRLEMAMKRKQEELEKRVNMIKDIKILAMIAKKAQLHKIIDLTETSGIGFLGEMSIAELQERLNIMKISLKEEIDRKKKIVKEKQMAAKQDLEETKRAVKNFMSERTLMRKQNMKRSKEPIEKSSSKEIDTLKKILEEKRKLRLQLTSNK